MNALTGWQPGNGWTDRDRSACSGGGFSAASTRRGVQRSFRHTYHAVRDSRGRIAGVSVLVDEVTTLVA